MTKTSFARAGAVAVALAAAVGLSACSAGQISQTAHQVAAVDGAKGGTEMNKLLVRDVTVVVDQNDPVASLKFTAINNDTDMKTYQLKSVTVDGEKATIDNNAELERDCMLVADTEASIAEIPQGDARCAHYTTATLDNPGFPPAGNVPVSFDFGDGNVIDVDATISAPTLEAGQHDRDYKGGKGEEDHSGH